MLLNRRRRSEASRRCMNRGGSVSSGRSLPPPFQFPKPRMSPPPTPSAGSGRKDILEFGEPDGAGPYLHVEIYRAGGEIIRFADPAAEIVASASALGPTEVKAAEQTLASKFGPLISILFVHCLERHTTAMPRLCVRIR